MSKKILALLYKYREQMSPFGRWFYRGLIAMEKFRLVNPFWRLKLHYKNRYSQKIRIGFGPIIERENTLGFRKWAIDPIVDTINRISQTYTADIFFGDEKNLSRFDILIIVKNIDTMEQETIEGLKKNNIALIYNPRDNPAGCEKDYRDHDWFTGAMDGFILSSPNQEDVFDREELDNRLIQTPIINHRAKKTYEDNGTLRLLWQGYCTNAVYMERLHPIIRAINDSTNKHLCLVYHCDRQPEFTYNHTVLFVQWKVSNWQKMLASADIGIAIKPVDNEAQQQKPPTKIISYMAAGLPVICTPSAADRLVIEHGRTGFFAYSDQEWHGYLSLLAKDWRLRARIGKAARESVLDIYSVDEVTNNYLAYLETFQCRAF